MPRLVAGWEAAESAGTFAQQQAGRWLLSVIEDRDDLLRDIRAWFAEGVADDPESFPEAAALLRRIDDVLGDR